MGQHTGRGARTVGALEVRLCRHFLLVKLLRGHHLPGQQGDGERRVLASKGVAVALSEDHKPQLPTELARIEKAGGWVMPQGRINGNLNLSRALGDLKYKGDGRLSRAEQLITAEPDLTSHTLETGDEFVVLACEVKLCRLCLFVVWCLCHLFIFN